MKKLLVIPIMGAYYFLMMIMIPFQLLLIILIKTVEWIEYIANQVSIYYEDYLMKPAATIQSYAIQIMQSDKTIKWIEEASEKLKHGKPID